VRSIWLKLFRALDAAEADTAAASAPPAAPGAHAAQTLRIADEQLDHDFYRRFVEQYCA
jgi:hypothetical protein